MKKYDKNREITLEESKRIALEILLHIDTFCKKYGIKYSLGEGTLLGAVRHKGFIPWDDDIDLLMTRDELEKFLRLYKDEYPYKLITTKKWSNWWNTVSRITDDRTIVLFNKKTNSSHGIWVALTPVDNVPDDKGKWEIMKQKVNYWKEVCYIKSWPLDKVNNKIRMLKNIIIKYAPIPVSCFNKVFLNYLTKYDGEKTQRMVKLNYYWKPFVIPSSIFDEYIELDFEGHRFMAVKQYHEYLSLMYGDYMTPPPVEERVPKHNFKAYYKN